jgi:murein L,D-transpeptidase YafK
MKRPNKTILTAAAAVMLPALVFSGNFSLIKDRAASYQKKYLVYINKKQKKLYLMDKNLKIWKNYSVATGAVDGGKLYAGDYRTPSGFYTIVRVCQYHEAWYMPQLRKIMARYDRESAEYKYYREKYGSLYARQESNRRRISDMNSAYLSAGQGHARFGTDEDLGYNSYGPVFMLLDYPNAADVARYRAAKKAGSIPADEDGYFPGTGGGIAIHGTNDGPSIGFDASSGCVRMKNREILELSNYVSEGTMVVID